VFPRADLIYLPVIRACCLLFGGSRGFHIDSGGKKPVDTHRGRPYAFRSKNGLGAEIVSGNGKGTGRKPRCATRAPDFGMKVPVAFPVHSNPDVDLRQRQFLLRNRRQGKNKPFDYGHNVNFVIIPEPVEVSKKTFQRSGLRRSSGHRTVRV